MKWSTSLVLFYLFSFYGQAQNKDIYDRSVQDKIDQVERDLTEWGLTYSDFTKYTLEEYMENQNVAGVSIAVIDNYKIQWAKGYGWADKKKKIPVTPETAFMTASISKSINAMGFLKLVEQGKIDLKEDINDILTSWQFDYKRKRPINTLQLLSHTSGIRSHYGRAYNHSRKRPSVVHMLDSRESMIDKTYSYTHSTHDPGQIFQYSNPAVSISEVILSDITKMPYEQYIKEHVLEPLGMGNSFYIPNKSEYTMATGYKPDGKQISGKYRPVAEFAQGGLWSTPTDLAKFIIDLQNSLKGETGQFLSKRSVELMLTPVQRDLPHNHIITSGLGSFIEFKDGVKYFMHSGEGAGFNGIFYGSYKEGNGVAILTNSTDNSILWAIYNRVAQVYEWENFVFNGGEVVDEVDIPEDTMLKFAGKYKSVNDQHNEMEITVEGKYLIAQLSGGDNLGVVFYPLSSTTFWAIYIQTNTTIKFTVDDSGKVDQLVMSNENKTSRWKRMED